MVVALPRVQLLFLCKSLDKFLTFVGFVTELHRPGVPQWVMWWRLAAFVVKHLGDVWLPSWSNTLVMFGCLRGQTPWWHLVAFVVKHLGDVWLPSWSNTLVMFGCLRGQTPWWRLVAFVVKHLGDVWLPSWSNTLVTFGCLRGQTPWW